MSETEETAKNSDEQDEPEDVEEPEEDPEPPKKKKSKPDEKKQKNPAYHEEVDKLINLLKDGLDKKEVKNLLDGVTSKKLQVKLLENYKNTISERDKADESNNDTADDEPGTTIPFASGQYPNQNDVMQHLAQPDDWSTLGSEPLKSEIPPLHAEGEWTRQGDAIDMQLYVHRLSHPRNNYT
jgi:hypothetical protein